MHQAIVRINTFLKDKTKMKYISLNHCWSNKKSQCYHSQKQVTDDQKYINNGKQISLKSGVSLTTNKIFTTSQALSVNVHV